MAEAQTEAVEREVAFLRKALATLDVDLVLLKGAAYLIAGLPAARGRVFSDVDILVPFDRLAEVEAALMLHGWTTTHHDAYDQRYYRQVDARAAAAARTTREGRCSTCITRSCPSPRASSRTSAKLLAASRPIAGQNRCASCARSTWCCTAQRICFTTRS